MPPRTIPDRAIVEAAEEMIAAGYHALAGDTTTGARGQRRQDLNAASDYLRALLAGVGTRPAEPPQRAAFSASEPCMDTVNGRRVRCVAFARAEAIHQTDRGLLVVIGGEIEHWMAKSQIAEGSEVTVVGQTGRVVISRWLAEQLGLV